MNTAECAECGNVIWYDPYIQSDHFACPDCGAIILCDPGRWEWFEDGPDEEDWLYDLYVDWA